VTELVDSEQTGVPAESSSARQRPHKSGVRLALLLGALGIVYGDIGTSPLYAMQTVFSIDNGAVRATPSDVFGIVSLVFWSITLIVSLKYVIFILRADNDGEGGVMALAALAQRVLGKGTGRRTTAVLALGVLGASLFYGDSVITPAISVLSAVEGLKVSSPSLAHLVLPISAGILTVLFAAQRFGTQRVGSLFGPIMVLWFGCVGVAGLRELIRSPRIIKGLSPSYAFSFIADRPYTAFIAMGAVVLVMTGAEALYADMGHFGAKSIRLAWFGLVFPALTLNYLAQGSLILRRPASRSNPFFLLYPHGLQLPMVILATVATVIASQAVISGAFSVSRQALRLGFLPHVRIRQTSEEQQGQIYVPSVNIGLFVAVLLVVFTFRSSNKLATAYGVAVTGTFLITTCLFLLLARSGWRWPAWRIGVVAVLFGVPELTYFAANLTKIAHGGWFTLLIAAAVFTVMVTWQRGRVVVTDRRVALEGSLSDFITKTTASHVVRVPGMGVFPHPTKDTTPLALRSNVAHNHVLHERVVIISGRTAAVPHIPWEERLSVEQLGDPAEGFTHVDITFGFQDRTDFPEALHRAMREHPEGFGIGRDSAELAEPAEADESYFLSRVTLRRTHAPGLADWRKRLFIVLAHNAASQAEFLGLPNDRTVILSAEIPV
jgi:KUP system potassium uptake protein